ncbi:uncharacterized protein N7446_009714 [Penicillium canescens]|uniref:uncharacterized protein n=1 Tax=Penicillium canescens TaxID=5083 RepID=UPI0026E072A3|nr:uncharacterized protein N7446_009714 [Penicillium canescens]KAJ6053702.1 hypothetical protein N7446_009714 [Penicillium canescens]
MGNRIASMQYTVDTCTLLHRKVIHRDPPPETWDPLLGPQPLVSSPTTSWTQRQRMQSVSRPSYHNEAGSCDGVVLVMGVYYSYFAI